MHHGIIVVCHVLALLLRSTTQAHPYPRSVLGRDTLRMCFLLCPMQPTTSCLLMVRLGTPEVRTHMSPAPRFHLQDMAA